MAPTHCVIAAHAHATLARRFDLIYLVLDQPNEDKDRHLARHLVSLYFQDPTESRDAPPLSKGELSDYLSYVKVSCRRKNGPVRYFVSIK